MCNPSRVLWMTFITTALIAVSITGCNSTKDDANSGARKTINSRELNDAGKAVGSISDDDILSRSFVVEIDGNRIAHRDFKGFSKGASLPDSGSLTFSSKKPKPDELTEKEKGLLVSAALGGLIYNIASYYVETGKIPQKLTDLERYQKLFSEDFRATIAKMSSAELAQKMSLYVSPVSGKVLRFDARDFEPGQAFITIVTDESVLIAYHKKTCQSPEFSKSPNKRIAPVYFRVYGERGIIAEEMMEITIPKVGDPPLVIYKDKVISDDMVPNPDTKESPHAQVPAADERNSRVVRP